MSGVPAPEDVPSAVVEIAGVDHHFGAVHATRDVSLRLHRGEIHAFVGENGAGKSTLLGMLAGRLAPDRGSISVFGSRLELGRPRASREAGIVAIYQELTMIPARPAYENVFLGQLATAGGWARDRWMRARFDELCAQMGVDIPAEVPVAQLSVADQQLIEIMRAIQSKAGVLLFDEPTASLAEHEREKLFGQLHRLRAEGRVIVLVSHNLDEVLAHSDRVSVFREGGLVATAPAEAWTKAGLVRDMLGRELGSLMTMRPHQRPVAREYVVAHGLSVPGVLRPMDVTIRRGEVLGIAGLVGSGRTTLLRALFGLEHARGGLTVDGRQVRVPRSAREARRRGFALIPEDRKAQGLVLGMTSAENVVLPDLRRVSRGGVLSEKHAMKAAQASTESYGLDPARLSAPAWQLSGGNQQKLLLGRWTYATPAVLFADEPTRGIDLGAKSDILHALRDSALTGGMAVVVVSSELEEVLGISDRVIVLREGEMVAEFDCHASDVTVQHLLHAAFGVTAEEARTDSRDE